MKIGEKLGHYRIIETIGVGGMGEVYLAEDTKLDRKVAVKVLSRRYSRNSKKLGRFIREAKAASALNHPNIVTIYDFGEADGARYIALEYIDGETLNEFLTEPHTLDEVLDIAVQIASALDAAHTAGIVHRDIKPDNIMIRPDGFVKILDFGIAKLVRFGNSGLGFGIGEDKTLILDSETNPKSAFPDPHLTLPGMVIGTANYMSPEQAQGSEVDARTDIFSFGVILYKMLAGYLPFEGETQMETIASIINQEPKPLTGAEIPPEIKRIIFKALRKDRGERYGTIRELLTDIRAFRKQIEHHGRIVAAAVPERENAGTRILNAVTVDEPAETVAEPAVTVVENRTTSEDTADDHITIKKSRLVKILAGIVTLLLIAAALGWGYRFLFPGPPGKVDSVAVMPFTADGGQSDLEPYADSMTEKLIERLSKIPNLEVRASSSVFAYRGKDRTPRQIGNELRAEALLFGKIGRQGEDLVLRLELVDTRSVSVLWSKSYERRADDLVSLENDAGADVAEELRSRLRRPEERRAIGP